MKENILSLIEHDINISRFLHFQRLYLQIDLDKLTTGNSDVILNIMQIKSTDEVHERYFELIDSAYYLKENEEIDSLIDNIFIYLVSLQGNPETRINNTGKTQIGVLNVEYNW